MSFLLQPWHIMLAALCGLVNQRQQQIIEFQNAQIEALLKKLGKSPNLNAYLERWFRSLKSECLDRMIFFGQKSLENAVREYVQHYHAERNHQGLGNELIEPGEQFCCIAGRIERRERHGGLLKYYHRSAS